MSYFDAALKAEAATGLETELTRSIFRQESTSGQNTSTSNAGAVGGMQVTPGAFTEVADKGWDINNQEHNARAGIRYARKMLNAAGGNPELAAAGYYGGLGAIHKAQQGTAVSDPRNPKAPNTLQYGQQVASRMDVSKLSDDELLKLAGKPSQERNEVDVSKLPDAELLKLAGAPGADIPDPFKLRQGVTAAPAYVPKAKPVSTALAAITGAAEWSGAKFPAAALAVLGDRYFGSDTGPQLTYDQARKTFDQLSTQAVTEHPLAYTAGSVAGAVVPAKAVSMVPGVSTAAGWAGRKLWSGAKGLVRGAVLTAAPALGWNYYADEIKKGAKNLFSD